MSGPARVVVIGGAGKVSLLFAARASKSYEVISLHRSAEQRATVEATGAQSVVFDVEKATVSDIAQKLEGAKVVVWSAGAGGKGGEDRTKAVDFEAAVKTFDAIESLSAPRPRLLMVSAHDLRSKQDNYPAHYNDQDKAMSQRVWKAIPAYIKYKFLADADLVKRSSFEWTILRPGGLTDAAGTGKVALGRTHIEQIPRADVAAVLAELLGRPEAKGLALDLMSGDVPVAQAAEAAIAKGETDWQG
ncbi:NAD(P)-binding protein [Exidia glandulosa HHB12029]|uniref:NAD(P)-binding protein n=1 Tax=Exidia glandulosa HHB12029 TaxID=1314781 RepID=A0A165B4U8_EXIGL|nr:NAD(P)-binding protein [Exidia glandulosa HHB12029]